MNFMKALWNTKISHNCYFPVLFIKLKKNFIKSRNLTTLGKVKQLDVMDY